MGWKNRCDFGELKGKVLASVDVGDDFIGFNCADGNRFSMCHEQDCCENVYIEDICGDLEDLIGSEVLLAEEVDNIPEPESSENEDVFLDESHTWTFYKISTVKASVTIRWFGSSNGYYSESVDFERIPNSGAKA